MEVENNRVDPGIPDADPSMDIPPAHFEYTSVSDPRFVSEDKTLIECKVVFPALQADPVPFVASMTDDNDHTKMIFQEIMDGKWGRIAPMCKDTDRKRKETGALSNRNAAMASTDWLVSRHRDEVEFGDSKSLTDAQFRELQGYRSALREWPTSASFPDVMPTAPTWLK